jgi:hypothetical protein
MRLEKYESKANKTETKYTFISQGPNGNILKGIEYSKTKVYGFRNVYNLAFGDIDLNSGEIDDLVVTNNQDREKVLATVANTVIIFTKRRPKAHIYIRGSTRPRTRLYQMAISKYLDELSENFDIKGQFKEIWLPFNKTTNFDAFLIIRKKQIK